MNKNTKTGTKGTTTYRVDYRGLRGHVERVELTIGVEAGFGRLTLDDGRVLWLSDREMGEKLIKGSYKRI